MRLSEYSDDELIEELKHRGIKIKVECFKSADDHFAETVIIGGVVFELRT